MFRYILKRLAAMIPVLLAVTFLMFALSSMSAGDPARVIAEKVYGHPTPEQIDLIRHREGFDRPFVIQYVSWLKDVCRGDFGASYSSGKPAFTELTRHLPETLKLAATSLVILLLVSVPLGILSALKENRLTDRIIQALTFVSVSLPSFWVGLMMLYIFGVKLRVISVIGGTSSSGIPIVAAITFDIGYFGILIRLIRTNLTDVLKKDYIRACRAKGLPAWKTVMKHGLKNSVTPVMTRGASMAINMLCGSAVIETIFSINGIGKTALEAVVSKDTPVLQCFILLLAAIVVAVNLLLDILYSVIDRRIQLT